MTLSERISEAIETSGASVSDVARACGISPQAVYQWMTGETKEMMADNLVELANITGYEARWIAKEVGPKTREFAKTEQEAHVLRAMQKMSAYEVTVLLKVADSVVDTDPNGQDKAA